MTMPQILDGGLATEFERRGRSLADPLWSAKILLEEPELVAEVHRDYLDHGADIVTTSGYQASLQGLARRGLSPAAARDLLAESVAIAVRVRDAWSAERPGAQLPRVAASIGSYGAYLANGAEFRGEYGISPAALADFHRERFEILASAGADLLAFETIPTLAEVRVLIDLLADRPQARAWISVSCRDDRHVAAGEPLVELAAMVEGNPQVVAVGANCFPPSWAPSIVGLLKRSGSVPVVVYPNAGEGWDPVARRWSARIDGAGFLDSTVAAARAGADIVGGCCRTVPADIRSLRDRLQSDGSSDE
jgi:homocysteine S-methyltransferase